MTLQIGEQHWTCAGCGWRNLFIRKRCRNCGEPDHKKTEQVEMGNTVSSTSDERTVNNDEGAMRHNYRVLTEAEKFQVTKAKDIGQLFLEHLRDVEAVSNSSAALDQSRVRIEEAVMWAVKHITK